jgi:tetratricopeptide (TPR) repeat protein
MVLNRKMRSWIVALTFVGAAGCGMQRVNSNQMVGVAGQYIQANNVAAGMDALQQAVDLDPTNALAHYQRGLMQLQHYSASAAALESLETSIELGMDTAEVHYQRGIALMQLDQPSDAEQSFQLATDRDPNHGLAWYRWGVLLEGRGEIRGAIDLYTRSIYASPRLPVGYSALGKVYMRFGRPSEAVQVFRNALANENPNDTAMRSLQAQNRADLGMVYLELGQVDEAVQKLTEAASMLGSVPMSLSFNLGVAWWRKATQSGSAEDRGQARHWLERARTMCDPNLTLARCESIEAAVLELERTP